MARAVHKEPHFLASDLVRDIVIGMSDGLTVPFALAAGLSGAVAVSTIIVTAGLAEIVAGSIAMGLGGYLAARGDVEHYRIERAREEREIVEVPEEEKKEVTAILKTFGLTAEQSETVFASMRERPDAWVDFMMRFELGLEEPDPKRALSSALTIGLSYIAGGLIPLIPYMLIIRANSALLVSVATTLVALFGFGYIKGRFTGTGALRSALQTVSIGGLAAGAAFLLARLIS